MNLLICIRAMIPKARTVRSRQKNSKYKSQMIWRPLAGCMKGLSLTRTIQMSYYARIPAERVGSLDGN